MGSGIACHAGTVEVLVSALTSSVEGAAASSVDRTAAFAVEPAAVSVAWVVASAVGWDIPAAWVDMFALVDAAAACALATGLVLAV